MSSFNIGIVRKMNQIFLQVFEILSKIKRKQMKWMGKSFQFGFLNIVFYEKICKMEHLEN